MFLELLNCPDENNFVFLNQTRSKFGLKELEEDSLKIGGSNEIDDFSEMMLKQELAEIEGIFE